MFCSQCGTQLDSSAKFCPSCGNGIAASTTGTGAATSGDKEPTRDIAAPKKTDAKRKTSFIERLGIVVFGSVALAFVLGGLVYLSGWRADDARDATSPSNLSEGAKIEAVSPITDDDYFKCVTLLSITTSADPLQLLEVAVQHGYRVSDSEDPLINMTAGIQKLTDGINAEHARWKEIGYENWVSGAKASCSKVGIER